MIQLVFEREVIGRFLLPLFAFAVPVCEGCDVAASAEGAAAALDHDGVGEVGFLPFLVFIV